MSIVETFGFAPFVMKNGRENDEDDYCPDSELAVIVDLAKPTW